jgi:hypothetical protein
MSVAAFKNTENNHLGIFPEAFIKSIFNCLLKKQDYVKILR